MARMRRAWPALLLIVFAVLFVIVNRGAYQGFFHGDELDNIQWTRYLSPADWLRGLLSLKYYPQNFRPVGHFYFNLMGRWAALDFRWYVLSVHLIHLLNVALIWRLLRTRFSLPAPAAAAGCLLFGFHMGVFDALWKPMYIFDLLAAACSLWCLLWYARGDLAGRLASFVPFWLAFKSKEMAVMLPAVLAAWEFWLGRKKWKPLLPFFALSLALGAQALLVNVTRNSEYTLEFAPAAIWKSLSFYAGRILLVPYAGLGVLAAPWLLRDRRAYFGISFFLLLLFPMLLLSRRLFPAYLYLPLAGLAMVGGVAAARVPRIAVAAFFVLWLPFQHASLRAQRREALSLADENRRYVSQVREIVRANPEATVFIYDGVPAALHSWGIAAAVRYFAGRGDLEFHSAEQRDLARMLRQGSGVVLLSWDPVHRELQALARAPSQPEASYIRMGRLAPVWQLGEGWYSLSGHFRWCRPYATARLRRPPGTEAFELEVNMGPPPVRQPIEARVFVNGEIVGAKRLARGSGWHTLRWPVKAGPPGAAWVEFRVEPPFVADPVQPLGLAIGAFGFVGGQQP